MVQNELDKIRVDICWNRKIALLSFIFLFSELYSGHCFGLMDITQPYFTHPDNTHSDNTHPDNTHLGHFQSGHTPPVPVNLE